MVHHDALTVRTQHRAQWIDITSQVNQIVLHSCINNGICIVSSIHTTAGITINENADPDVGADFFSILDSLIPQKSCYQHAEGNSDSHVKASLVGFSVHLPIRNGKLVLGTWQSIYLCEFDGPRDRTAHCTAMGDPKGSTDA